MGDIAYWKLSLATERPPTNGSWAKIPFDTAERVDAGANVTLLTGAQQGVIRLNNPLTQGRGKMIVFNANLFHTTSPAQEASMQSRVIVTSGTAKIFTHQDTSYIDSSGDGRFMIAKTIAYVYDTTGPVEIECQWRGTATSYAAPFSSDFCTVQVYDVGYNAMGHYSVSTTGQSYGGPSVNVVPLDTTITEDVSQNISRSGSTITLTGGGRRYLTLWSVGGEGSTNQSTGRIASLSYDGVESPNAKSIGYMRDATHNLMSMGWVDIFQTTGASHQLELNAYRGDHTVPFSGGSEFDSSWAATHAELLVIEVPSYVSMFKGVAGGVTLLGSGLAALPLLPNGSIEFSVNQGGNIIEPPLVPQNDYAWLGEDPLDPAKTGQDMLFLFNITAGRGTVSNTQPLKRGHRLYYGQTAQASTFADESQTELTIPGNSSGTGRVLGGSAHGTATGAAGLFSGFHVRQFVPGSLAGSTPSGSNDEIIADGSSFMVIGLDDQFESEDVMFTYMSSLQ